MELHKDAVLVRLNVRVWRATKQDKKRAKEVTDRAGAQDDSATVYKRLLDKQALSAITTIVSRARDINYKLTVPWWDNGTRLIPCAMLEDYKEQLRKLKDQFDIQVAQFLNDYQYLVNKAPYRLAGLFEDSDYPEVAKLREKFSFDFHVSVIPDEATDIRVNLNQDEVERITQDIRSEKEKALSDVSADLMARLHDVLAEFAETMKDSDKVFRDKKLWKIDETCDVVARLNFVRDPKVDETRRAIKRLLATTDPDTLRVDKIVRADRAAQAQEILAKMSGYVTRRDQED